MAPTYRQYISPFLSPEGSGLEGNRQTQISPISCITTLSIKYIVIIILINCPSLHLNCSPQTNDKRAKAQSVGPQQKTQQGV